jgi:hypothetical protein
LLTSLVLKYSVKQLFIAALLKLVYIALVLKEVLALFLVAVVVLELVEEDLRYYIVASFVRIEEKQAF